MRHIDPARVLMALDNLHQGSPALFTDYLLMKYEGLGVDAHIEVTATSTNDAIRRFMDLSDADDDGQDPAASVNFNPLAPGWRVRSYARTGPLSNIDGGALNRIVDAPRTIPRQVTLKPDYIELMKPSLLARKRSGVPRIPLQDIAIWNARFDELDDDVSLQDLASLFVSEYRLSEAELDAFFDRTISSEQPFVRGPVDRDAVIALVKAAYPPVGVPAMERSNQDQEAKEAEAQAEAELPANLLDEVRQALVIPDVTVRQILTLLRLGRNIILTGAPGTGKTTLAIRLAELARKGGHPDDLPKCAGHLTTTATADWTTFDTIGGLAPDKDGRLAFREGMFLRAVREDKWLIIDEVNRADVDKAFGQLFTVLSGHAAELPFSDDDGHPLTVERGDIRVESRRAGPRYEIGSAWRIIGTMNSFDRSHLFQLSSAFVRRFAFINVPVPTLIELDAWLQSRNMRSWVERRMRVLIAVTQEVRPLGPAIIADVIEYVAARIEAMVDAEVRLAPAIVDGSEESLGSIDEITSGSPEASSADLSRSEEDPFLEAVVAYVLPQMDGLDIEALRRLRAGLGQVIAAYSGEEMDRQFKELFRF